MEALCFGEEKMAQKRLRNAKKEQFMPFSLLRFAISSDCYSGEHERRDKDSLKIS